MPGVQAQASKQKVGAQAPTPMLVFLFYLAEEGGFEPPIGTFVPYNGLANRRLQPLGHPSICPALGYRPQNCKRYFSTKPSK